MSESPVSRSESRAGTRIRRAVPPPVEGGAAVDGLDRRHLLKVLTRLKKGDFTVRLEPGVPGVDARIADTFNEVVELNQRMSLELARLSDLVGKQGRISERASLGDVQGSWASSVRSVNTLIGDLARPTIDTSRVIGAVAKGDLSQTMDLESAGWPLRGEFLRTARTINTMVHQLSSFASEVTRVAREPSTTSWPRSTPRSSRRR